MAEEKVVQARKLLDSQTYGVLSTISVEKAGFPFGSLTPYCLDKNGEVIILISDIAEHTHNIKQDPKVSLTIVEDANTPNIQTRGRITYLGYAQPIAEYEFDEILELYCRIFPDSRRYFETHGFHFYRIQLHVIRYIGGFGKIYWIEKDEILTK